MEPPGGTHTTTDLNSTLSADVYLCAHSSRLAAGGWSALVLVVVGVVVDIGIYIEILQSPGFLRG